MRIPEADLRNKILIALTIFIISFFLYLPSLWHSFVGDDVHIISSQLQGTKGYGLFLGGGLNYYRPFSALSLGLDYKLWYLNPMGFHLTNILLNSISGAIVFLVASYLFEDKRYFPSFLTALLFILHPAHADSAAWIAGRTDIISSLFFFLALLSYMLFREKDNPNILFLSALFFLFSLFGKEVGIVFPLVVLSYDTVIKKKKIKDLIFSQAVLFVIVAIYFLLRKFPHPAISIESNGQSNVEGVNNLFLLIKEVLYSFGFYIKKLALPLNMTLFPDIHHIDNLLLPALFISFLLIALIKRSRILIFGLIFIVLTILPTIPVIFMDTLPSPVAVRYLYLPVFGFSIITAYGISKINRKYISILLITVLVMFYGVNLHRRNMNWKDNGSLWSYEVKKNKDSAMARLLLSHSLYNVKKYDESEKEANYVIKNIDVLRGKESVKANFMARAYSILGKIYIERRELDTAERYLLKAIGYKQPKGSMYHNLGTVYLLKYKQYRDMTFLRDAYSMYKYASKIEPGYIPSKYGLAHVCELLDRKEEALKYYEEVLNADSRSPLFIKAYNAISRIRSSMKNELP